MDSASQESLGVQGALAFAAATAPMRIVRALMVGAVFGIPGTAPPWHTPHALHLQENTPSGLCGSSVLDTSMTIWRKEDKFKGKKDRHHGREAWGTGVQLKEKVCNHRAPLRLGKIGRNIKVPD